MTLLKSIRNIIYALLFVLMQILIFRHLQLYEVQPDVTLVFLIWAMASLNRTHAIILAGITGLFQDALLDMWGLNLFTKTLATFLLYNFVPKTNQNRPTLSQVFIMVLIFAFIHNIIFLNVAGLLDAYTAKIYFWRHWFGGSLYSAVTGLFIYFFYTDR